MRSLSDICVPDGMHEYLRTRGWGIIRARDFGFDNQPDENVWGFARTERRVLISADYDFRRFRQFPLNNHSGCIIVNISRGFRGGETVTALAIRILASAWLYLPTYAEMRESHVYLESNSGVQTFQDGSQRTLYRLT